MMVGKIELMFLEQASIEKDVLRQGDIIANTHILGAMNLNAITYLVDSSSSQRIGWQVSSKPPFAPAIVLSHSCELDRKGNGIKVTSIVLAPLRDLDGATAPEKISELKESNIITEQSTYSYLKYFYLEYNPLLPQYSQGCVVDFSKIYSVRKQSYDKLLEGKIIQLRPNFADYLATKLALYYYRNKTA